MSEGILLHTTTNASGELPKVVKAEIILTDAFGGVTKATATGDNLISEVVLPRTEAGEFMSTSWGDGGLLRGYPIAGNLGIRGFEAFTATYTAPERPAKRWEVGQIVKLTKSLTPPNFPYHNAGFIGEVTGVTWLGLENCWQYHIEDRYRKHGLYLSESKDLDRARTLDRWPFRAGDFVTFEGSDGDLFKLIAPLNDGDLTRHGSKNLPEVKINTGGKKAWHIETEDGLWAWLFEEHMIPVDDVKVVKTVKWERG